MQPIGVIQSCYRERFGVPRQSGLVPEARSTLILRDDPELRQGLRGLEGFSHVWVVFEFHEARAEGWKGLVRPPRLGGNVKMGVFATRSPHRPNGIGISAVELEKVEEDRLVLKGGDFLDGTPVLDVKPYLAYADSIPGAKTGWVEAVSGEGLSVEFAPGAAGFCDRMVFRGLPRLRDLISQTLRLDPRPAHQTGEGSVVSADYAMRLLDFDVCWRVSGQACTVTEIRDLRV